MTFSDYLGDMVRLVIRTALDRSEGYVRPANQHAPVGDVGTDYATVKIDSLGSRGTPTLGGGSTEDPEATDMDYYIDEHRFFTASVQFFKPKVKTYESDPGARVDAAGIPEHSLWAYDQAVRLPSLMWRPQTKHVMHGIGLAYLRHGVPKDLSALNDSLWESRGQVDLEFSICSREVFRVNLLAGISGRVIVSHPGGTKQTIDIEV